MDILGMVFGVLDQIFYPIYLIDPTPNNPMFTVFIISTIISLITTIANKYLVDQDEMNRIQAEMKEFNKKLREAQQKGDGKELAKLQAQQGEMMQQQSEMMTNSFKPMIATMVPILLIFWWMRFSIISHLVVMLPPSVYYISLTPIWHWLGHFIYGGTAIIPFGIGWLLWYMICTFAMSQIIRKFLGFKQGF
ncbi:MAG: EMC3/TMCO1 family protein [archaeon]|nr:EMC3/TMCO1 family protein [archaeon]